MGHSSISKFQFHKVRLKAYFNGFFSACYILFQFHKVRLKGRISRVIGWELNCFNSIRYD